jgi:hypothetical protein
MVLMRWNADDVPGELRNWKAPDQQIWGVYSRDGPFGRRISIYWAEEMEEQDETGVEASLVNMR